MSDAVFLSPRHDISRHLYTWVTNYILPKFFAASCSLFIINTLSPQLIVQAYDNGFPSLTDTEVVTVTVNRNTQPPAFNNNNYEVTIFETQSLGDTIVRVTATDPDALFVSMSLWIVQSCINPNGLPEMLSLYIYLCIIPEQGQFNLKTVHNIDFGLLILLHILNIVIIKIYV